MGVPRKFVSIRTSRTLSEGVSVNAVHINISSSRRHVAGTFPSGPKSLSFDFVSPRLGSFLFGPGFSFQVQALSTVIYAYIYPFVHMHITSKYAYIGTYRLLTFYVDPKPYNPKALQTSTLNPKP